LKANAEEALQLQAAAGQQLRLLQRRISIKIFSEVLTTERIRFTK
jgi:hypothetical protein